MKKVFFITLGLMAALSASVSGWAATNNSGNAPTFLWLDVCTNGIGDYTNKLVVPRMSPDTVDIGVDLDADGTVDRWLSKERTEFLGRDNAENIQPDAWRRYLIRLDSDAGKKAKIRIVDKSDIYYIAVKAIRLNYADGVTVPNLVPNGFFEEATPLKSWKILEGSITDAAKLIAKDTTGSAIFYGSQYYSTKVNGVQDTATIESDVFTLQPPTSFVYGMVSGGASELWNIPGAVGSDNLSYVYLDIGTTTQDPNGKYDAGVDVPLTGFFGGPATGPRNQMHPVFLNTSGLEGKRAQVVVVDDSSAYAIGVDSWRMNWDPTYIPNGGFEQDLPDEWFDEVCREYIEHPSKKLPGWTVSVHKLPDGLMGDASVFYYDKNTHNSLFADRAYVGTGGNDASYAILAGVELRSSVFTIQPIPDPSKSVFLQFASAQGSDRIRRGSDGSTERGSVELHVDVDGNGQFTDAADSIYRQQSQGLGWNLNTSNMDLWHYPEYRFYISAEHQGKMAQIYVEDTLSSGYGWMCVDDFYLWDGSQATLPFVNSDFEQGNLNNWTEVINDTAVLRTWLSGSQEAWVAKKVLHRSMNNRFSYVDGDYSADTGDTADDGGAGGDAAKGSLTSVAFKLPTVKTGISDWPLFE